MYCPFLFNHHLSPVHVFFHLHSDRISSSDALLLSLPWLTNFSYSFFTKMYIFTLKGEGTLWKISHRVILFSHSFSIQWYRFIFGKYFYPKILWMDIPQKFYLSVWMEWSAVIGRFIGFIRFIHDSDFMYRPCFATGILYFENRFSSNVFTIPTWILSYFCEIKYSRIWTRRAIRMQQIPFGCIKRSIYYDNNAFIIILCFLKRFDLLWIC